VGQRCGEEESLRERASVWDEVRKGTQKQSKFLLQAVRAEAAYFHWIERGRRSVKTLWTGSGVKR
jgi:hypothetical protein